jgi:hypothetical protein
MNPPTWYRLTIPGHTITGPMTPERAEDLQARGFEVVPAARPADLDERLMALVAALLRPSSSLLKG